MSFGEKIKQRREELSLTQEDIGACISAELSRQAVSKWEQDIAYPEVKNLLLLSVKLDVSLDAMFTDELAYLRRYNECTPSFLERYPGMVAGLKTIADAVKKLNL